MEAERGRGVFVGELITFLDELLESNADMKGRELFRTILNEALSRSETCGPQLESGELQQIRRRMNKLLELLCDQANCSHQSGGSLLSLVSLIKLGQPHPLGIENGMHCQVLLMSFYL